MSTAPPAAPAFSNLAESKKQLIVYHHSGLFYWWPIWVLGFLMALITYWENHHMAIVPEGTQALESRPIDVDLDEKLESRDVLVLPEKSKLVTRRDQEGKHAVLQPTMFVSVHKTVGTLFVTVLLLVIAITNIPMRGLWSVLVIVAVILVSLLFALFGWWETIFANARLLSIHINMGGYLSIAIVLLILWLVNFFFFDRQTYMIFTPGQVRMRLEIGGGETVYDTLGMVVHKQRGDLFRHLILGFGSGDLEIRPAGISHFLHMPNVLRVTRKVKEIEHLVSEKVILSTPDSK